MKITLAENCLWKLETITLNRKFHVWVNVTLKSTKVVKKYIGIYVSKSN